MNEDQADMKRAMMLASDGILGAAVLIVAGVYGGSFIDEKLNSSPWFCLSLSVFGGGLGLARLVKKALAINDGFKGQSKKPALESEIAAKAGDSTEESVNKPRSAFERFED